MTPSSKRGRVGLLLALTGVLILIAFISLPFATRSRTVTVMVGQDGQARLFGIPLGNGKLRHVVFSALFSATAAEVGLSAPPTVNITNIMEISLAMTKAGWTNRNTKPNEYE